MTLNVWNTPPLHIPVSFAYSNVKLEQPTLSHNLPLDLLFWLLGTQDAGSSSTGCDVCAFNTLDTIFCTPTLFDAWSRTLRAQALHSLSIIHLAPNTLQQTRAHSAQVLMQKNSGALSCLQARLLQHERNSGQLSTAQEAMARKCDELHRGMAAKQADCAAALARCGQQQEQINSLRSLLAASQVGEEGNGVELAVRHPI